MPRSWPIGCRIGTGTIKGEEKRVEPRGRCRGEEGVEAGMMGRRSKLPCCLDLQGLGKRLQLRWSVRYGVVHVHACQLDSVISCSLSLSLALSLSHIHTRTPCYPVALGEWLLLR